MTHNEQLAYAAGLFDGEGSCGVYFDTKRQKFAVAASLGMCSPQGPSLMVELFGSHIRLCKPRGFNGSEPRVCYLWSVRSTNAAKALEALLPWLREKKAQATCCLEAYRIQQGRPRGRGAAHRPEDRAQLFALVGKTKALKRSA